MASQKNWGAAAMTVLTTESGYETAGPEGPADAYWWQVGRQADWPDERQASAWFRASG